MKQTVQVMGMTCQNCRSKVETKIAAIEGLSNVVVSLENAEASFDTTQTMTTEDLERILGEKYTVHSIDNTSIKVSTSKWKALRPLFLIFGYIVLGSLMLTKVDSINLFMTNFMGLFYLIFGFFKFLDYKGFSASFQRYDPLAKRVKLYAWFYPFIETILGLMFLLKIELTIALWVTVIILGITTIGVAQQLINRNNIQCACLGTALNLPMTEATLIENSIMLFMAFSMLSGMF